MSMFECNMLGKKKTAENCMYAFGMAIANSSDIALLPNNKKQLLGSLFISSLFWARQEIRKNNKNEKLKITLDYANQLKELSTPKEIKIIDEILKNLKLGKRDKKLTRND